jgi:hypothetical protein
MLNLFNFLLRFGQQSEKKRTLLLKHKLYMKNIYFNDIHDFLRRKNRY